MKFLYLVLEKIHCGGFINHLNLWIKKWLPTLTFIGVILPVLGATIQFHIDKEEKQLQKNEQDAMLEAAIMVESCMNRAQAEYFSTGKSGDTYMFNNGYSTDFYHLNWAEVSKAIIDRDYSTAYLFIAVYLMEGSNNIHRMNNLMPSDTLNENAENIIKAFDSLGFNKEFCKQFMPLGLNGDQKEVGEIPIAPDSEIADSNSH